jgi:hypothetical protein
MNKPLLVIGLTSIITTTNTMASWELAGKAKDTDLYIDRVSKLDSQTIEYWSLMNFYDPTEKLKSTKTQQQGNCSNLSLMTKYSAGFSGVMGTGEPIGTYTPSIITSQPTIPDSIGESALVLACLKAGFKTTSMENVLKNISNLSNNSAPPVIAEYPIIEVVQITNPLATLVVESPQVNIRQLPNVNSDVIGLLNIGTFVQARTMIGKFYEIETMKGKGYIHKSTVKIVSGPKSDTI